MNKYNSTPNVVAAGNFSTALKDILILRGKNYTNIDRWNSFKDLPLEKCFLKLPKLESRCKFTPKWVAAQLPPLLV